MTKNPTSDPTSEPNSRDEIRQILLAPAFLTVTVSTFCFWMAVFAHTPLIPLYMSDLGHSESTIGVVFGSGAAGALIARLAIGWMVDRYGERLFMLVGAGIWLVTAPLIPATESTWLITVVWLVKGAGLAIFTTASGGWAGKYGPDRLRGRTMSYYGAANFVAAIVSPAAAVALARATDYSTAFLVTGVTALLACGGALVPASTTPAAGPAGGADEPRPAWWRQAVERSALATGLIGAAVAAAFTAFNVYVPLRVDELGDFNPGLVLSVYGATTIVILPLVGRSYDQLGRSAVLLPALLSLAAGLVTLSIVTRPAEIVAAAVLVGVGVGAGMPALTAWTAERADVSQRANAQGTFWTVYEIGLFLGSLAMGAMFAPIGYGAFAVMAGLILFAAAVYALAWGPLRRGRAAAAERRADHSDQPDDARRPDHPDQPDHRDHPDDADQRDHPDHRDQPDDRALADRLAGAERTEAKEERNG